MWNTLVYIYIYININFFLFTKGRKNPVRERDRERGGDSQGNVRFRHIFRFTSGGDISPESVISSFFFHGRLIQGRLLNPRPSGTELAPKTARICLLLSTLAEFSGLKTSVFKYFFGRSCILPMQFTWHFRSP